MYSMSLALTLAAVYLALEAVQRRRWQWIAAYVAVAWLALHTHYYAFFVLASLTVFLVGRALVAPGARPALVAWIWWNMLLALLYLPWLASASDVLAGYHGNGDSPNLPEMLRRAIAVFAVGESAPADQRVLWALLAGLLLLLGMTRLASGGAVKRRTLWLLFCYLFVPLFLTWWGARERPIFDERYLIAASPAFYLLLAAGASPQMGRRPARWDAALQAAAVVGLVVLSTAALVSLSRYATDPAYSKTRGWRALAAAIERFGQGLAPERVRIAQNFPDPTLWYYYRGEIEHLALPPAPHDEAGSRQAVANLTAQNIQRVILPLQPAPNWDDTSLAAASLAAEYDLVAEESVGVWPLQVYAGGVWLDASRPVSQTFANGVVLTGVSGLAGAQLAPDGLLSATLDWLAPAETIGNLKVTVQLLGPDGRLVAQQDRLLAEGRTGGATLRRSYGLVLPTDLPSGRYKLVAALYDPDRPGNPRISTSAGTDAALLAEFEVKEWSAASIAD